MDVVIAGAGPVGLLLAIELQRRSVYFRLFEGGPPETGHCRLQPASLQILDRLGCVDEVLDHCRGAQEEPDIEGGLLAEILESELRGRGGRVENMPIQSVKPLFPHVELELARGLALQTRWLVVTREAPAPLELPRPAYRSGRILLAGSAAHDLGCEAGLEDAFNLAWKLASVVRGEALENLLDTYPEERQSGRYLANGAIPPGQTGAAPGQPIDFVEGLQRAHLRRQARLLDLLRGGEFHLLAFGPPGPGLGPLLERLRQHFGAQLRAWYFGERPPEGFSPIQGPTPWGDGPGAILVRPDHYVGWRGQAEIDDELNRFLTRVSLNY